MDTDWLPITSQSESVPLSAVTSSDLAYVIYTSGSTGLPKGVTITQNSILNYHYSIVERLQLKSCKNFALVSTISADLGHTIIFPCLSTGGCLHILSEEVVADPDAFAEYFSRYSIDCLKIVPSHLAALQTQSAQKSVLPRRMLILGGEASSSDWVKSIQDQAPECTIFNHYGPTETTVGVLTYCVVQESLTSRCSTVPLGKPIGNTKIYILDKQLQPVPVGVEGELYIGGAGLARGYLKKANLSA
ncbi:MAG: AMP-binding protein, partial [Stigonema ocellatum SAG 48.90 = DSM 106950]|nr:AMP-binding protein [Stigonema ocellatum SAG 48.90 = DSM 106950]